MFICSLLKDEMVIKGMKMDQQEGKKSPTGVGNNG
jgi:hypothetical protein